MSITITSQVNTVVSLLGNRSDLSTKIASWIADGYRDIAMTIPLETLEETETDQTVFGIDSYNYPASARAIKSLSLFISNAPRQLTKRNIQIIDQYQTQNPAVPAVWAPFNNQMIVRPVPNGSYDMTIRFWQTPQIAAVVGNTILKVPPDWIEIINYEAVMRGWIDLQEMDKAANIRTLLYGNPMKPGMPGLIKQRLARIQAESSNANYGMRPRTTRYTNVR